MKQAVTEYPYQVEKSTDYGIVTAKVRVTAVGFDGRYVNRRITLGAQSATLDEAKETIKNCRENNSGLEIDAQFTIRL